MHKFAPLLCLYTLAPTCFGSSLQSSGSFWIRLSYVKIQLPEYGRLLSKHVGASIYE
jgi:hypothetical protein